MSRETNIKVPDFLKKENAKGKTSLERKVANLASFLHNDYPKLYDLGVQFEISMQYLEEDFKEVYSNKSRYEMIKHLLSKYGYGLLTTSEGTFKCTDPVILYDVCCGLNQKNKRFKISSARRKLKEGKDFRFYDAENVYVIYKASGGKSRKLKK